MFTDNSACEAALYKGNSFSPKLFDLVLRFRKLEMDQGAHFHVVHCSDERMKAQGADGASRGHLKEGVTAGMDMLSFIPLNETCLKREQKLKDWVKSWAGANAEFLEPKDWFGRGHDHNGGTYDGDGYWRVKTLPGTFVWAPPPATVAVAFEELRKARIKRQDSMHIFVVPRLLTPEWLKQTFKASDVVFHVPIGCPFWPQKMFEPLTIGLCFPFISSPPWQLRGTPKMLAVVRQMRRVFEEESLAAGSVLRKLLLVSGQLRTMPEDVVQRLLRFES
jgi:hypothetical protein